MTANPTSLLKLQIGPVQDFIAQARSTRDLWSGSYLLSWLIAAGIRRLRARGGSLVFPNPTGPTGQLQPLFEGPESWRSLESHVELLTPNLTNIFAAKISAGTNAREMAEEVQQAITDEWAAICEAVWRHSQDFIEANQRDRFYHQLKQFLSISWQITPLSETGYAADYQQNAWQLDAVRQTRDFKAWGAGLTQRGSVFTKDSLSGKDEAIAGGPGFVKRLAAMRPKPEYAFLFKHDDWVGAIALVKRVWHLAYLKEKYDLRTAADEFSIRSTRAIAAKSGEHDDFENVETAPGDKYFAVLAFDGDQIGMWLSDEFRAAKGNFESYHAGFSAALSTFALQVVRPIVENTAGRTYGGFLVYAGGDDVLALLPAERALQCAQELRTAFQAATNHIIGEDGNRLDASVGIAIAHFKAPLQDVVRAARAAEKRAKQKLGRAAVAVSLFKRSGEITEWGCRWESGGLQLYDAISDALAAGQLSAKFPYRVAELLQPYLTATSQLTKESRSLNSVDGFDQNMYEIICNEFATVLGRQTPLRGADKKALFDTMTPKLKIHIEDLETMFAAVMKEFEKRLSAHQTEPWARPIKSDFICGRLIELCQTVAFADRNRDDADHHPAGTHSTLPISVSVQRQPVA